MSAQRPSSSLTRTTSPGLERGREEHLVFSIDGLLYAIALSDFEIVAECRFEPQPPGPPACWIGTSVDRGSWVPVLELHRFVESFDPSLPRRSGAEARLIRFAAQGAPYALRVDRCLGVFLIPVQSGYSLRDAPVLRTPSHAYREVLQWNEQLVVALVLRELVSESLHREISAKMEERHPQSRRTAAGSMTLVQLRELEIEMLQTPSIPNCMDLARRYQELGQDRDAGRLIALAESLESGLAGTASSATPLENELWMCGTLGPQVLVQVLQVAHLKGMSGELVLEGKGFEHRLYFNHGRLIQAEGQKGVKGLPVVRDALDRRSGGFVFHKRSTKGIAPEIADDVEELLHQALRSTSAQDL